MKAKWKFIVKAKPAPRKPVKAAAELSKALADMIDKP
jgi:hypothetical protein